MYINPYGSLQQSKGQWLRANFHTHAGTGPGTCGVKSIDDVVAAYSEAGYGVLTISNHDLYSDVSEYQNKYDITLINGFEYSATPHMLCIGTKDLIEGNHQEAIVQCKEQGGLVILCHPNWQRKEYWPMEQLDNLKGYMGIEIYNSVIFRLSGSGLATDTWDHLLSGRKLVWGFGDDDFHRWYDMAKSWNMIYSASRDQADVMEAMREGSFYVSTGLILNEFAFNGSLLTLKASSLETYVKNYTYRFIGRKGQLLREIYSDSGVYEFTGQEEYVRVQVVSEHGAMLWTQPIYKEGIFKRP